MMYPLQQWNDMEVGCLTAPMTPQGVEAALVPKIRENWAASLGQCLKSTVLTVQSIQNHRKWSEWPEGVRIPCFTWSSLTAWRELSFPPPPRPWLPPRGIYRAKSSPTSTRAVYKYAIHSKEPQHSQLNWITKTSRGEYMQWTIRNMLCCLDTHSRRRTRDLQWFSCTGS